MKTIDWEQFINAYVNQPLFWYWPKVLKIEDPTLLQRCLKEIEPFFKNWNLRNQSEYTRLLFNKGLIKTTKSKNIAQSRGLPKELDYTANGRNFKSIFEKLGFVCEFEKDKFVISRAGMDFINAFNCNDVILNQLLKWQFWNPSIKGITFKEINIKPFCVVLTVMMELDGYLSDIEMALFVNKIRHNNEIPTVINQINEFRLLTEKEKKLLIKKVDRIKIKSKKARKPVSLFTKILRHIPSYIFPLFEMTKLVKIDKNAGTFRLVISANKEQIQRAINETNVLFPFEIVSNPLSEWNEFFTNPSLRIPPKTILFSLRSIDLPNKKVIVSIKNHEERILSMELGNSKPMALYDSVYDIFVYVPPNFNPIKSRINTQEQTVLTISISQKDLFKKTSVNIPQIGQLITELSSDAVGDSELKTQIELIKKFYPESREKIDKQIKRIRGGRLEELLNEVLLYCRAANTINKVCWNGGRDQETGLPFNAPSGAPDIQFWSDKTNYIVETTLAGKREQAGEVHSLIKHMDSSKAKYGFFISREIDGYTTKILHDYNNIFLIEITDFSKLLNQYKEDWFKQKELFNKFKKDYFLKIKQK